MGHSMDDGQRDGLEFGWDGAGRCEMSSCYSEWHAT